MRYVVTGCIQGTGMSADHFYNMEDEIEAVDIDDARRQAVARGIWVDRIMKKPNVIYVVTGKDARTHRKKVRRYKVDSYNKAVMQADKERIIIEHVVEEEDKEEE